MAGSSLKAALLVNLVIGIMKMFVGLATASAAMVSEAYHSFADTFNQILLALGIRRSKQSPDLEHPFGYQKESFFWSFVVAVLIFGVSGLLALNEGIHKLGEPHSEHDNDGFIWNIVVLLLAIILEGYAFRTAYNEAKEYKELTNSDSIFEALDEMQDPVLLSLLTEDSLALVGLSVALVGVTVTYLTENPFYDGLTSIFIGVILIIGGLLLAKENKTYLIGKSVANKTKILIDKIINEHSTVEKLISRKTMLLGPKDMILALDVKFLEDVNEPEEIDKLEAKLVAEIPHLTPEKIFIEAQD